MQPNYSIPGFRSKEFDRDPGILDPGIGIPIRNVVVIIDVKNGEIYATAAKLCNRNTFTEFTNAATNDVAADSISEQRLTPIYLTIQSNTNIILFSVPGVFVCAV